MKLYQLRTHFYLSFHSTNHTPQSVPSRTQSIILSDFTEFWNKSTMSDIDYNSPKPGDSELQDFLQAEKQKAQFHAQIHEFNDFCWDKCVDKPGTKLDSRTETCITNCVERFIDTSLLVTNRFAQMLEKGGGMH